MVFFLFWLVVIILGYACYEFMDIPYINYFWVYLDNQSVAMVIAFVFALFGYYVGFEYWKIQHRKKLSDQYVREFVDFVIRWYTIKKDQTNYRISQVKAQKKKDSTRERFWHERIMNLDTERTKTSGQIDSRSKLLLKLDRDKPGNAKTIKHIYVKYQNFGAFEKKELDKCHNPADYNIINIKREKSYKEILSLISNLNL